VEWIGIDSRYFLLAAIPTNIKTSQCVLQATRTVPPLAALRAVVGLTKTWVLAGTKDPCRPEWLAASELPVCSEARPGSSGYLNYRLYMGPKDLDHLRAVGGDGVDPRLEESVDFWIVGILARPMVWLLKVFHDVIPHWGVAIILLTILVKLLLLPLTHKSFMSMQGMQKLKPEMELLKEKYGNDRQKLNEEMMALYKRHKVNPLGGCLPMLLQMPVYIALYRAIYSSVELFQAPLFGWIHDLSAPDPYFVLPLVLGLSMFLQQQFTPTSLDSAQAKMMKYIMPVMFTVFMLFLPSGLVLYIFVNTLLSMAQQWYIKKKDPATPRPARAKA
jgi:YidC/Oxa1 family membrane protein insertase